MDVSKLNSFFLATLMAFAIAVMLPACSSSDEDEAPPPADTGGDSGGDSGGGGCERGAQGICCDIDPMQEGCRD